jgi:general secretion pathway protein B
MSFILDALKKSETERQQQGGSDFANVPSSSESPGAPRWLWVLGLLLAVNLAVLLGVLLRDDSPQVGTPLPLVSETQPPPATGPSFSEQIREARGRESAAGTDTAIAAEPAARTGAAIPPEPAAETVVEPPRVESVQARPQPEFTLAALPTADELRANGRLQMPDLHLDIHVYSTQPAERFVFINMVRHREKSRLAEGPVVQEITPEGVILDYGGTRFLLPRE